MSQMNVENCTFPHTADGVSGYSALHPEGVPKGTARDDVELFNSAMEERPRSFFGEAEQDGAPYAAPVQEGPVPPAMPSPLESLFAGRIEEAPAAQPILTSVELEALVERILVSTPESGVNEVRLALGGERLKGTEVVIRRDALGQLSVQLHANEAAAFQALSASQAELRQRLEDHESAEVSVTIAYGHSGNDTERRSRGLFQQYPPEA